MKRDILIRIYLVFLAVAVFGVAILVQGFRIQSVRGDYWLSKSDSLSVRFRSIEAERGNIMSSDGRMLATTLPTFEIRMDMKADGLVADEKYFENHVKALSQKLASTFRDKSANEYERQLTRAWYKGARYHLVKRRVNYNTMLAMKEWPIWERGQYKGGLIVIEHSTRKTPFGKLAHRSIGYNRENAESIGLEAAFNEELQGQEGQRLMQRIAGGTWIPLNDKNEIEPRNGNDIITTIDVNVQDVTESALEYVLADNQAEWGCAVIMEVATGKIRAIANLTSNGSGGYVENYNYAVGYRGEPGSTMKLVTLAALLEDEHVAITDSVDLNRGYLRLVGRDIYDSEGHPYRNVTIKKAFERSSNVAFTRLAHKYYQKNPKQFIKRMKDFNIDQKYGIEIPGERTPLFYEPGDESWSNMSLTSLSFGYEIEMTPIQMLAFYNAIANDGKLMKPYLVEKVVKNNEVVKTYKPEVVKKNLVSNNTLKQLQQCLVGVVKDGTGKNLFSENYQAAGKTGTTKLAVPGHGYGKYYTASFAGYFPADNPQYSCIIMVNKPTAGKYYGSSVAGPVFKQVADMLYARSLTIQKELNDTTQFAQKSPAKMITEQDIQIQGGKVPDVRKMGLDDAIYVLENAGLRVRVVGRGIVKQQSLTPGSNYQRGATIKIELGT
ncbi:MAG: transpeptidase family protein [Saprospiraceae bacterium]|nr:transpeptidase family protein [Saprospiraceae bacterium]